MSRQPLVEVVVWSDETAGWRCLRTDCGRWAGPYGSEATARVNADLHDERHRR